MFDSNKHHKPSGIQTFLSLRTTQVVMDFFSSLKHKSLLSLQYVQNLCLCSPRYLP